jgi:hypothetical protein
MVSVRQEQVMAAAYLCFPASAAGNLVKNPGFEDAQQAPWNNGSGADLLERRRTDVILAG